MRPKFRSRGENVVMRMNFFLTDGKDVQLPMDDKETQKEKNYFPSALRDITSKFTSLLKYLSILYYA